MARVTWNGSGAIRISTRSVREGIRDIMQEVFERAVEDAPLDTGDLKQSARLNLNQASTSIIFDVPYAAIQHENLDYNHPKGGKAKYLEDAFNDIVPGAVRRNGRLQAKVNDDLRRG